MLFRLALLEDGAEERLSAGFGRRQSAAASLSAAGPVPESGASSQKWQATGRQNAAFGQILGAGAFEAAGKPCPTGCGTALPSGQPGRTAPRDSRKGAQISQKLLPWQELPISIHAPREGSDLHHVTQHSKIRHFYPHSPQGERRQNPTNIKDGFCVKVPNKNLKYTKQNAILCIQHNFNIDGRGLQGGVRCESSGQTMCAGTSRGQCAAAHKVCG